MIAIVYLINTGVVVFIFMQNRNSSSKLSWIVVITILPFFGHLLYFLVGQKYRHRKDYDAYYKNFNNILKDGTNIDDFSTMIHDFGEKNLFNQLSLLSQKPILPAKFKMFSHPYKYFNSLFEHIEKAQKEIWIVSYYAKDGELVDEFFSLLIKKATNGVKIKWLIDDFGQRHLKRKTLDRLKHPNIEIEFIGRLRFGFLISSNFYRNHRKFFIIDKKIVFNGGSNISDRYISLDSQFGYYHDINYMIKGPYVHSYIIIFIYMWKRWRNIELRYKEPIGELENNFESRAIIFEDGPELNDSIIEDSLIKLIANAKEEIKISTPYFSLSNGLFNAFKIALLSGVKVSIFYPGYSAQKLVHQIGLVELKKLEKYGIKIYFTNGFFNHSKMGIFDKNIAYIGTLNFDIRSFYAQYETIDIVEGEVVKDIQKLFDDLEQRSVHFLKDYQNMRSFLPKQILFKILKPLT
ncbi:phospholipase D-like domain-containing protein [Mycoplasmopsis pulmonis]|nr:phospholipase D-like domain-containing protein [Mycoplasmopsis pulmonis]MDZ7293685.1 phospholipase D-like domain-containing protein [Mycoplasmopsis pulmonis]VEU68432.1 Cardiolipin synthase [Mycoplasmopsis pulmonis]